MPLAEQFNSPPELQLSELPVRTPAYIYDENTICRKLEILNNQKSRHLRVLYSVKAMSCSGLLQTIAKQVDGFSTSSLFEFKLAREILPTGTPVHITSPCLDKTVADIIQDGDYVSFNSLSQWQRLRPHFRRGNFGLRLNPEKSFVEDARYDPCREYSKLGVPVSLLKKILDEDPDYLEGSNGIHIHNNCESGDFSELVESAGVVTNLPAGFLRRLQWINLGGGYLFNSEDDLAPLNEIVRDLGEQSGLEVFVEPGKAIVGDAGFLAGSVIDKFENHDRTIVVLDTSVNHLPEVFEYQYRPVILEEVTGGGYTCRLAGASCLSGDIFGDYTFNREPEIGDRITFARVGAYMQVKAHMFNGINLPSVYSIGRDNRLQLHREFGYGDYRCRL